MEWRAVTSVLSGSTARQQADIFPITPYQADMVAASAHPDTSDAYHLYFTLQWGFRVRPGMRPRQLQRVFDKLVARHDSLRLRFVPTETGWAARIDETHPTGLTVTDLAKASADEQQAFLHELSQTAIKAHEGPCFELHLIRCGGEGDVVLLKAHHAIIDGYGLVILGEDLLKLFVHMPLSGQAMSHAEFVVDLERQTRKHRDDNLAFWMDELLPLPEDLNIGRVARGLPAFTPHMMDKTISLPAVFDAAEMRQLEELSASSGATVFSLIYVAFCDAICAMAGQDRVMVCSWLGRQDAQSHRFVGCDNRMVQLIHRCCDASVSDRANAVAQNLYVASDALPSDVFLPGSPFMDVLEQENRTLWRFQIHNSLPAARLSSSPFGKFFWAGLNKVVRVGPISIEKLTFERSCESRFELSVFINQSPEGHNATLVADAASFDRDELERVQAKMKEVLYP